MTVKRVLLTGSSTGIGNATLQRLVANGHDVTTLDVQDAPAGSSRHFTCDLSDPASIDAVVDQLDGPYDAVGNIAGVAGSMGAELVLRVNVYGLRHLTERLLATGEVAAGGSIVNIASVAARTGGLAGIAAYAATKGALVTFTRGLSNEVASEGIRVNSVSPGIIATDMIVAAPDAQQAAAASPLGRMGRPDEVAATVSWLISPAASFITGSDITVSGGR